MVAALQSGGFRLSHTRRSHYYLRAPDARGRVVVPVHGNRDLPLGTLRSVLRQAELTADELVALLRR